MKKLTDYEIRQNLQQETRQVITAPKPFLGLVQFHTWIPPKIHTLQCKNISKEGYWEHDLRLGNHPICSTMV